MEVEISEDENVTKELDTFAAGFIKKVRKVIVNKRTQVRYK